MPTWRACKRRASAPERPSPRRVARSRLASRGAFLPTAAFIDVQAEGNSAGQRNACRSRVGKTRGLRGAPARCGRGALDHGRAAAGGRTGNQGAGLNGADPYLPAYRVIDSSMRETLAKDPTLRFQFFAETLDAHRFAYGGFEQDFLTLLVNKYKGVEIDVVVAVTRPAFDFADRHRDRLWPNAWVLFHGIAEPMLENVSLRDRTAGVIVRRNMAGTVDLARRLQPDAQRLLVVAGVSEVDKDIANEARKALATLPESLKVEYVLGLPQTELMELMAREPASSIVLYLTQFRDREGRPYTSRDVLRAMSAVSPAPIYSFGDTYLGYGIAAGIVEPFHSRGLVIAERLLQLAAGASIPVFSEVPDQCAADARALRKWSLDVRRLPEGCEIRFAGFSVWREYRWQILGTLAVVLFQAAMITWLLFERRRRILAAVQMGRAKVETASIAKASRIWCAFTRSAKCPRRSPTKSTSRSLPSRITRSRRVGGSRGRSSGSRQGGRLAGQDRGAGLPRGRCAPFPEGHGQEPRPKPPLCKLATWSPTPCRWWNWRAGARTSGLNPRSHGGLPPVFVDRIHIQQVVLNLARNAIEAAERQYVRQRHQGRNCRYGEKRDRRERCGQWPGDCPEDAEHIFDPFYSTKGSGLGVGLSISRAIVEAHGGELSMAPNEGGGCIFRLTLLAASQRKLTSCQSPRCSSSTTMPRSWISIVELVTSVGLKAATFRSAQEFRPSFKPEQPGCLVLDVRMAHISGPALQEELNAIGARIPIVFISAHADISVAIKTIKAGAVDFVQKPYREQQLLDSINEALRSDAAARQASSSGEGFAERLAALTDRERERAGPGGERAVEQGDRERARHQLPHRRAASQPYHGKAAGPLGCGIDTAHRGAAQRIEHVPRAAGSRLFVRIICISSIAVRRGAEHSRGVLRRPARSVSPNDRSSCWASTRAHDRKLVHRRSNAG